MARQRYNIPAALAGFAAVVLLILSTVSLPTTAHKATPFGAAKADRLNGQVMDISVGTDNASPLDAIVYGNWGYCTKPVGSDYFSECTNPLRYDYTQTLASPDMLSGSSSSEPAFIPRTYTRGLVEVVVAMGLAIIAFIFAFIPGIVSDVIAAVIYILAFLASIVAFFLNLTIFLKARLAVRYIYSDARVYPQASFYMTLISIPLLAIAAIIVGIGALRLRKERRDNHLYEKEIRSTTGSEPHVVA